jgi:preprotein translocase subunit YajC
MIKALVRATLLALALPLLLNATHILKNDILKIEAEKLINEMGDELFTKTGINGYVIATNEHFPVGFNFVEYSKKYEKVMSKPYVLFIFASQAKITEEIEMKGRVGLIPSSDEVRSLYNYNNVRDAAVNVVSKKDSNTDEDKHNIGVLQAFSELADDIAASKSVELTTTIPNDTQTMVWILRIIIYIGAILVLWIYVFRRLYTRMKNGRE